MQELGEVQSVPTDIMMEMIKQMKALREAYEATKKIAKAALEKLEEQETKVQHALEASGLDKFAVPGIGTAYLMRKFDVKVPKDLEAKRALFKYIRETYNADVLDEYRTINYQTLNAFYKQECEHLGDGVLIPGLGEPTLTMTLGFRKK